MGTPIMDLTGRRFGRLYVERLHSKRATNGDVLWECRCDKDGNLVVVRRGSLRAGLTLSCGCLNRENTRDRTFKDLTGKTFGFLKVLAVSENRNRFGQIQYICRCERDGNIKTIVGGCLVNGRTVSCGCFRDQRASDFHSLDLVGRRFGRLIVLRLHSERTRLNARMFVCACDGCGSEHIATCSDLVRKHTTSCGCASAEAASRTMRKRHAERRAAKCGALSDQIAIVHSHLTQKENPR